MGPKKTVKTVTVSVCVGKMHSDVSLSLSLSRFTVGGVCRGLRSGFCRDVHSEETLEFLCH